MLEKSDNDIEFKSNEKNNNNNTMKLNMEEADFESIVSIIDYNKSLRKNEEINKEKSKFDYKEIPIESKGDCLCQPICNYAKEIKNYISDFFVKPEEKEGEKIIPLPPELKKEGDQEVKVIILKDEIKNNQDIVGSEAESESESSKCSSNVDDFNDLVNSIMNDDFNIDNGLAKIEEYEKKFKDENAKDIENENLKLSKKKKIIVKNEINTNLNNKEEEIEEEIIEINNEEDILNNKEKNKKDKKSRNIHLFELSYLKDFHPKAFQKTNPGEKNKRNSEFKKFEKESCTFENFFCKDLQNNLNKINAKDIQISQTFNNNIKKYNKDYLRYCQNLKKVGIHSYDAYFIFAAFCYMIAVVIGAYLLYVAYNNIFLKYGEEKISKVKDSYKLSFVNEIKRNNVIFYSGIFFVFTSFLVLSLVLVKKITDPVKPKLGSNIK